MNRSALLRLRGRPEAGSVRVRLATNPWTRLRGWMGMRRSEAGAGLWLAPCNAVHTMFMRFPVDVVSLSGSGTVLAIREQVAPWRLVWPVRRARSVLELPAGEARRLGLGVGDRLVLEGRPKPAAA